MTREEIQKYKKEYRLKNLDKIKAQNRKWRAENSEKVKENNRINREKNPDRIKEWHKNNPEKSKIYKATQIKYYEKHPEKLKRLMEWRKNYQYKYNRAPGNREYIRKLQNDNAKLYPYRWAWRGVLRNAFRGLGKKKEGRTIDLLGYSATDLKIHIEKLFKPGMSWDNWG